MDEKAIVLYLVFNIASSERFLFSETIFHFNEKCSSFFKIWLYYDRLYTIRCLVFVFRSGML